MQPYFFPYLGYFQLLNYVDEFVLYDNIQFTKKGWIHRNRILMNGAPVYVSLPLKKDSDYLDVVRREIAESFVQEREKMLRRIAASYRAAPQFSAVFPMLEDCLRSSTSNLFVFLRECIRAVCSFIGIETRLVTSSTIPVDHTLRAQDKVIAICGAQGASGYINPIGGVGLYSADAFARQGVELQFLEPQIRPYAQGGIEFVPNLSMIDVMMWVPPDELRERLQEFRLVA
ncbi:hypothetical protein E4634_01875 [Mangrovimicrobium sediminis]|uniref:WbqC family protein n=2 Tax=Mangrovimicrobium sediminis TaxID=2562682 RepID=A0A4Z0M8Z3_9GAMM|nr:hypothetical protein E4634_01875 [Haliea sp. SAOS-164]